MIVLARTYSSVSHSILVRRLLHTMVGICKSQFNAISSYKFKVYHAILYMRYVFKRIERTIAVYTNPYELSPRQLE